MLAALLDLVLVIADMRMFAKKNMQKKEKRIKIPKILRTSKVGGYVMLISKGTRIFSVKYLKLLSLGQSTIAFP